MWLSVEHVTRFSYDGPITEAYTELRLKPAHRSGQRCSSFSLVPEPRGATVAEYVDRFGNTVHHFDVLEQHDRTTVTARSEIWTAPRFVAAVPLSPLDRFDLLAASRYVPLDDRLAELAGSASSSGDPAQTAGELMHVVRSAMTYERGTTNVHTTAAEALAEGVGVCQDFSHVMIGACRVRRIPARYVSGYLYDPTQGDLGESHAWVDVHVANAGWAVARPDARHRAGRALRPARRRPRLRGRPPSRGVYEGNADETLEVAVAIREP